MEIFKTKLKEIDSKIKETDSTSPCGIDPQIIDDITTKYLPEASHNQVEAINAHFLGENKFTDEQEIASALLLDIKHNITSKRYKL